MATLSHVTTEQLESCRKDPAWETVHGLSNGVVCRECGAMRQRLGENHFAQHGMTTAEYQRKWDNPPIAAPAWFKTHGFQRLGEDDLAEFRATPQLETQRGMKRRVVCRECGAARAYLDKVHFAQHGTTPAEYQRKWDNPPVYAPTWLKQHNRRGKQWRKENPQTARAIVQKYLKKNKQTIKERRKQRRQANLDAQRKHDRDYNARRRRDPQVRPSVLATERRWARNKRLRRASDAELERFLRDPAHCDFVVCLETNVDDPSKGICRAALRDIGHTHLPVVHKIRPDDYRERHPGSPVTALRVRTVNAERGTQPAKPRRGRTPGLDATTYKRIDRAAAFLKLAWTQKAMGPFVYPDTPNTAYVNTRNLFADFRDLIRARSDALTIADAEALAKQAQQGPRSL